MPTLVDSLTVSLGLDASNFKRGQQQTREDLKATQDTATRTAKAMQADGAKAAEFFSSIKTQALSLLAVFLGGKGIVSFIHDTNSAMTQLGNTARFTGLGETYIDAFGRAITRMGGNATAAQETLRSFASTIAQFQLRGGAPGLIKWAQLLGVDANTATPQQVIEGVMRTIGNPNVSRQQKIVMANDLGIGSIFDQLTKFGSLQGYNRQLDESNRLGETTPEMAVRFDKMRESIAKFQEATDKFSTAVLDKFAPGLTRLFDWMTNNVVGGKPGIVGAIDALVSNPSSFSLNNELLNSLNLGGPRRYNSFRDYLPAWLGGNRGAGTSRGAPETSVPYEAGSFLKSSGASQAEYDAFRRGVANSEGARYNQMGGSSGRFAGRYQMGEAEIAMAARRLFITPPTRQQFLNDPALQERLMEAYTASHHDYLMGTSARYRAMTPQDRLKALGYAHNQGEGGAARWLQSGAVGRDAFGTPGTAFSDAVDNELRQLGRRGRARNGIPPVGPVFGPQQVPRALPGPRAPGDVNSSSMDVGTINVIMPPTATDPKGIAAGIQRALAEQITGQANRGLQ